jgi:hypothetical protein
MPSFSPVFVVALAKVTKAAVEVPVASQTHCTAIVAVAIALSLLGFRPSGHARQPGPVGTTGPIGNAVPAAIVPGTTGPVSL